MKTKKDLTVSLVCLLAVWIVAVTAGGPSLAGAQQTQKPTEKGEVSAPETSSPGTQNQKPAPPAPQPSAPPAPDIPAPDKPAPEDKYEEYETQC